MTRDGVPALALGLLLVFNSAVLWVWAQSTLAPALLTAAGLALVAFGGALLVRARRGAGTDHFRRPRPLVDASLPGVIVAVGLFCVGVGAAIGAWLALFGGLVAAFGVLGLARETAAARREAGR
jgi:hypothetical protein